MVIDVFLKSQKTIDADERAVVNVADRDIRELYCTVLSRRPNFRAYNSCVNCNFQSADASQTSMTMKASAICLSTDSATIRNEWQAYEGRISLLILFEEGS